MDVNQMNKEIVKFPNSWAGGEYEYFLMSVDDEKLITSYNPDWSLSRVENLIYEYEDIEKERPLRIYENGIKNALLKELKILKEEDLKREQRCLELGLDKQKFGQLIFRSRFPNADRIASVYVMKQTGTNVYKIGFAISPEKRLTQANTFVPYGVELVLYYTGLDAYEKEYMLHKHFADERIREDAEWFELQSIDLVSIEKTFEHWLVEDEKATELLKSQNEELGLGMKINGIRMGINKGPFQKAMV